MVTILAVDDMPYMKSFYAQALRDLPVRFFFAADGQEAVEMAERVKPDLVFLDYMMPRMSGDVAMQKMREIPGLEKSVYLLVTAMGGSEDRAMVGFDEVLHKPVRCEALIDAVGRHLGLRPTPAERPTRASA